MLVAPSRVVELLLPTDVTVESIGGRDIGEATHCSSGPLAGYTQYRRQDRGAAAPQLASENLAAAAARPDFPETPSFV